MKKYLLILALVGFFFSCSNEPENPPTMTQDDFLTGEKSWADYVGVNRSPKGSSYLFYGSTLKTDIVELDLEKNIIGIDRVLANNNDPYNYEKAYFGLTSYSQFQDFSENGWGYNILYYYDIREGARLAPGSLEGNISYEYANGETPAVVIGTKVDMEAILAMTENEDLKIGDEVLLIDIYKDEAKTDLVETFSFIL